MKKEENTNRTEESKINLQENIRLEKEQKKDISRHYEVKQDTEKNPLEEYWLRGGFIGGIVFMIYFFIVNYLPAFNRFACINKGFSFNCFGIKIFEAMGSPAKIIIWFDFLRNLGTTAKGILAIIILLITYFLLGALIGYVYSKIKMRLRR